MCTDLTNYVYLLVIVLSLVQIYLRRIPALVTYRDHGTVQTDAFQYT
jgi:hypothetical protein